MEVAKKYIKEMIIQARLCGELDAQQGHLAVLMQESGSMMPFSNDIMELGRRKRSAEARLIRLLKSPPVKVTGHAELAAYARCYGRACKEQELYRRHDTSCKRQKYLRAMQDVEKSRENVINGIKAVRVAS